MSDPVWLPRHVIVAVQEQIIARFGGRAGIRDEGLLDSALGRPHNLSAYENPNLFQLAATYSYGIVKNHPFVDGNKRTAFMAAYIFLGVNGLEVDAPEEQVVLETLSLAAGDSSEADYAKWLERSCKKAD